MHIMVIKTSLEIMHCAVYVPQIRNVDVNPVHVLEKETVHSWKVKKIKK